MNDKIDSTRPMGGARSRSPQQQAFDEAVQALKVAVLAMDPSIKRIWVSHRCRPGEPSDGAIDAIIFDRADPPVAALQTAESDAE